MPDSIIEALIAQLSLPKGSVANREIAALRGLSKGLQAAIPLPLVRVYYHSPNHHTGFIAV